MTHHCNGWPMPPLWPSINERPGFLHDVNPAPRSSYGWDASRVAGERSVAIRTMGVWSGPATGCC